MKSSLDCSIFKGFCSANPCFYLLFMSGFLIGSHLNYNINMCISQYESNQKKEKDSVLLSRSSSFNDSHCKSDRSSKNSRDKLGIHQITSRKKMSRRSIVPVGDCFDDGHCTSNSSGKNGSNELSIHKTYLLNKGNG